MPWCRIESQVAINGLVFTPSQFANDTTGLVVSTVLTPYRDHDGGRLPGCTVVRLANRADVDRYSQAETQEVFARHSVATFAALSERSLGTPNRGSFYTNYEAMALVGQRVNSDNSWTSYITRQADGATIHSVSIDAFRVSRPLNAFSGSPKFNPSFADAVWKARDAEPRWQDAVDCFLLANTDSITVQERTEWTLLVSFFDQIFHDKFTTPRRAKCVAAAIASILEPRAGTFEPFEGRSYRKFSRAIENIYYHWGQEFYELRNQYAHGVSIPRGQWDWRPSEHLFLARLVIPLVAKAQLNANGIYQFEQADLDSLSIIEHVLRSEHLPAGPDGPTLPLLRAEQASRDTRRRMLEFLEKERRSDPQS